MSTRTLSAFVIDRDPDLVFGIAQALARQGFHVATRTSPDDSLSYAGRARPDLVLIGLSFWREGWGIDILEASPESVVIPLIGCPSVPWIRELAASALGTDAA